MQIDRCHEFNISSGDDACCSRSFPQVCRRPMRSRRKGADARRPKGTRHFTEFMRVAIVKTERRMRFGQDARANAGRSMPRAPFSVLRQSTHAARRVPSVTTCPGFFVPLAAILVLPNLQLQPPHGVPLSACLHYPSLGLVVLCVHLCVSLSRQPRPARGTCHAPPRSHELLKRRLS